MIFLETDYFCARILIQDDDLAKTILEMVKVKKFRLFQFLFSVFLSRKTIICLMQSD